VLNTTEYCLKGEIWADIPKYEGIYQASSFGRIRTVDGKKTHSVYHGIRTWTGRILKTRGINPKTGHRVTLWKNKKSKDALVARLVGFTFLGIPNDIQMTINHIDGNRFNNQVSNLEWLSLGDNIRHAFDNNLHSCCKSIKLSINNEIVQFRSLAKASKFIGRNEGYISFCLQVNKKIRTKQGILVEVV
jgi:hypothetical protein